jgi:hypothetical protein
MRIVCYTGAFFLILSFNNSRIQLVIKLFSGGKVRYYSIEFSDIMTLINKINVVFNIERIVLFTIIRESFFE